MKVSVLPRRGGKTTRMLEWMRTAPVGEHRVMICHSAQEAMRLYRENPDLESWQFASMGDVGPGAWSGVLHGRGGRIVLGVDNVDMLLSRWLMQEVGMMTVTGDLV